MAEAAGEGGGAGRSVAARARGCGVLFAGVSDTGRVRENNEDSYCLGELEPLADGTRPVLLAVADGLGGYHGGEVASSLAIRTLRAHLAARAGRWPERLRTGVRAAHAAIARQGRAVESLAGMATTLTAAVLDGRAVHWAHVGDSRAYIVRGGVPTVLTRDHSLTGELVAAGRMGREAARRDPRRHVLTQAVGLGRAPEVEIGTERLGEGEWLVLATDGLTAVVREEEIAAATRRSASPGAFCEALVALANARGGPDNITVVAAVG